MQDEIFLSISLKLFVALQTTIIIVWFALPALFSSVKCSQGHCLVNHEYISFIDLMFVSVLIVLHTL